MVKLLGGQIDAVGPHRETVIESLQFLLGVVFEFAVADAHGHNRHQVDQDHAEE